MKNINKWKIGTALMLVLVFALQLCMVGNSLASGEVWHCDKDNIDIDTDFCPKCGAARPVSTITDTSQSDTWFCPTCGKELPIDYNFCPDDRTEKTISQYGPWPIRNLNGPSISFVPSGKVKRQAYYGPSREYAQGGSFYPKAIKNMVFISQEDDYVLVDMSYSKFGKRCVYFESKYISNLPDEEEKLNGYPAVTTSRIQLYQGPGTEYDPLKKITIRAHPKNNPTSNGIINEDDVIIDESDNNNDIDIDDSVNNETITILINTDESDTLLYGEEWEKNHNDDELFAEWEAQQIEEESNLNNSNGHNEITYSRSSSTISLAPGTKIIVFFETNGWVFAEVETRNMLFRAWLPARKVEAQAAVK